MSNFTILKQIALSFPETTEEPHFENTSFRVKKKIFATYDHSHNRACLKFSEIDQSVFSCIDKNIIYPVPNKWGKQGWTFVQLENLEKEILVDALTTAYCTVAPKKLAEQVRPREEI